VKNKVPNLPPPACPTCGGSLPTERVDFRGIAIPGRSISAPAFMKPKVDLEDDPVFMREFMLLERLTRDNGQPGIDLASLFPSPIQHPVMKGWLRRGNEDCRNLPGRHDLVRRRRLNVLRWPSGSDRAMPYVLPLEAVVSDRWNENYAVGSGKASSVSVPIEKRIFV